nr:Glucose-1-phosphate cytidylyltransferase [Chlamydiota bacterium]
EKYLGDVEHAAVTYGDGLTNVNLKEEFEFHCSHGKIGTVLGVNPPSRFGEILLSGSSVSRFEEKPEFQEKWINGGFFFFKKEFFSKFLTKDASCILERTPLVELAERGQLDMFKHRGFWACMDTQRDRNYLNQLWESGQAPWRFPFDVVDFVELETKNAKRT